MTSVCCMGEWEMMLNKMEISIRRLASRVYQEAVSSLPKWFFSLSLSYDTISRHLQYCCKILVEAESWHLYSKGKWIPGCFIVLIWEYWESKPTESWLDFIQRESQRTWSLLWETPHFCSTSDLGCKSRYVSGQMWQEEVISAQATFSIQRLSLVLVGTSIPQAELMHRSAAVPLHQQAFGGYPR